MRIDTLRLMLITAVLLTATAVFLLPGTGIAAQLAAFLLLWGWPTLSWAAVWPPPAGRLEKLLLGAGAAMATTTTVTLLWQYVPVPLPAASQIGLYTLTAVLPLLWPRTVSFHPPNWKNVAAWTAVTAGGAWLRAANMTYKEIQGDEGVVLFKAADALMGDPAAIFLHQKGPMEIVTAVASWGTVGTTADLWVRLPFTWAGILVVPAVGLLAQRWFNRRVGLIAAALTAVMGFGIAFARILQYQSQVMLWGTLALLAATHYVKQARPAHLVATAAFTAAGLLAHYDAVLVVPALAFLLLGTAVHRRQWHPGHWTAAVGVGTLLLGAFYLPFVQHPNFARTFRYLLNDRVGATDGTVVSGSLATVWQIVTVYNSSFYIGGMALFCILGVGAVFARRRRPWPVSGAAVLMFAAPLLFYTAVVTEPRTHVYTIFPGAAVMAAVGVDFVWHHLSHRPAWRWAGAAVFGGWLLLCTQFVYLMFVDITVERQRVYPLHWPRLHPTSWDQLPQHGLFGFPYRAGWREMGNRQADADGWYASNEEELITDWYMAQAPRTHCPNADRVLVAERVQDEYPLPPGTLSGMQPRSAVVGGVFTNLTLYTADDPGWPPLLTADETRWLTPAQVAPRDDVGTYPVRQTFGGRLHLRGFDIDDTHAYPGGHLAVILYWEAARPMDHQYQTYVHLYETAVGRVWGTHDGAPECGANPTSAWESGQVVPDPHIIPISPDAPVDAPIAVVVGAYDQVTLAPVPRPDGETGAFYLRDVHLREP